MDVSGAVAPEDRPGLGQALELVRTGALQGIAVYDLSRFSRDTAGGLRALEQVAAMGGTVLSASEAIDLDTPAGVFSTTVQLAAHSLRRAEASRSWKATHARRFEKGLPHGKLPYGYLNVDGHAMPDEILGPAVTRAFTDYATGAVSQKQLATELGALRGRPMRQGVISQLLRNRFYTGQVEFLGQTNQGIHPPLVDDVTFQAVQRRLNWERAAGPHWRAPGSPVIGIVHCALCHRPMYRCGTGSRGGQPRPPRIICSGRNGSLCEGIGTPQLPLVEEALRDLALEVAADLADETPSKVERDSRAARARATQVRLRAEETDLLNQLGELTRDKSRKVISERAYAAAAAPIEESLDRVAAQLAELEVVEVQASRPVAELASAAERIRTLWPAMTAAEQRAQVALFVPRVEIRRAGYRGEPMIRRLILPDE
jgi:DNA invertase Pin-like site-specific DNA recombinase